MRGKRAKEAASIVDAAKRFMGAALTGGEFSSDPVRQIDYWYKPIKTEISRGNLEKVEAEIEKVAGKIGVDPRVVASFCV